ncbi:MAG: hypothetical protein ABSG21_14380, partial [Spirochaetia bacterium]
RHVQSHTTLPAGWRAAVGTGTNERGRVEAKNTQMVHLLHESREISHTRHDVTASGHRVKDVGLFAASYPVVLHAAFFHASDAFWGKVGTHMACIGRSCFLWYIASGQIAFPHRRADLFPFMQLSCK